MSFNPLSILRGTNTQTIQKENSHGVNDDKHHDLTIYDLGQKKAKSMDNMSALSVMLNDYADLVDSYFSVAQYEKISCLRMDDMRPYNWFEKFVDGKNCDNIFRNEKVQESVKNGFRNINKDFLDWFTKDSSYKKPMGRSYAQYPNEDILTQQDIFQQDIYANGGLKYGAGDDLFESALNFAKADISAIEKPYHNDGGYKNGALDAKEINSYLKRTDVKPILDDIKALNFDGYDDEISAAEYASWLLALDSDNDGIITSAEANMGYTFEVYSSAKNNYSNYVQKTTLNEA